MVIWVFAGDGCSVTNNLATLNISWWTVKPVPFHSRSHCFLCLLAAGISLVCHVNRGHSVICFVCNGACVSNKLVWNMCTHSLITHQSKSFIRRTGHSNNFHQTLLALSTRDKTTNCILTHNKTRSAFKKRRGWCLLKMNVQLLTQFMPEVCRLQCN